MGPAKYLCAPLGCPAQLPLPTSMDPCHGAILDHHSIASTSLFVPRGQIVAVHGAIPMFLLRNRGTT